MKNYLKYFLLTTLCMTVCVMAHGYDKGDECGDARTPGSYSQSNPLPICNNSGEVALSEHAQSSVSNDGCSTAEAENGAQIVFVQMNHSYSSYKDGLFALKIDGKYYGGWYNCGWPNQFLSMSREELSNIVEGGLTQRAPASLSCSSCEGNQSQACAEYYSEPANGCDLNAVSVECSECFEASGVSSLLLESIRSDVDADLTSQIESRLAGYIPNAYNGFAAADAPALSKWRTLCKSSLVNGMCCSPHAQVIEPFFIEQTNQFNQLDPTQTCTYYKKANEILQTTFKCQESGLAEKANCSQYTCQECVDLKFNGGDNIPQDMIAACDNKIANKECCDEYSVRFGADASGLAQSEVPNISHQDWQVWYNNQAINEDGSINENFCNYIVDENLLATYCDEATATKLTETHETYCNAKICQDRQAELNATNDDPNTDCQAMLQTMQEDPALAKCDPALFCPDSEELAAGDQPAEATGPCEKLFNGYFTDINKYAATKSNGEPQMNPFLLEAYNAFTSIDNNQLTPYGEYILGGGKEKGVHEIEYKGSSFFKQCQRYTLNEWGDVKGTNDSAQWSIGWAVFVQKNIIDKYAHAYKDCSLNVGRIEGAETMTKEQLLAAADGVLDPDTISLAGSVEEDVKTLISSTNSFLKTMRECGAIALMTDHSDYGDDGATEKKKASADGSIQCIREGVLTQDYKACNNIINAYDAALLAEQGIIAAQQIDFTSKQTDWQLELQEDEDAVKGPIRLQIKTLEQQQDYATQQGVAYTAKGATLGTLTAAMPTMKSLRKECKKGYANEFAMKDYAFVMSKVIGDNSVQYFDSGNNITEAAYQRAGIKAVADNSNTEEDESATVQSAAYDSDSICGTTLKNYGDLNLILNDTGKSQALAATIQAGIQAAEQGLIVSAIGKNIEKLNAMLNDIDDYDPSELSYSIADLLAQECEINPDNEACSTDLDSSTRVGFVGQSFSVGSTGRSGTGDYTLPDTDATVSSTTSTSDADTDTIAAINTSSSGSSGISNAVRAGSLKAATRSGGSGGVSAGRVSAPSGGSSGSSAARSPASRYKSKDYSYNGSSKGVSYSGGSSKSSSKSSSSNPFSKLFNKSAKSGKDVVNFRELASSGKIGSSSGRNLFKMISDRYDSVSKNDQLLEYTKE